MHKRSTAEKIAATNQSQFTHVFLSSNHFRLSTAVMKNYSNENYENKDKKWNFKMKVQKYGTVHCGSSMSIEGGQQDYYPPRTKRILSPVEPHRQSTLYYAYSN